jgi:hypothetical protein
VAREFAFATPRRLGNVNPIRASVLGIEEIQPSADGGP